MTSTAARRTKAKEDALAVTGPIEALAPILSKLDTHDQVRVSNLHVDLTKQINVFGHAGLQVGRILAELQSILEPRKLWTQYLHTLGPGMSPRSAYRYIGAWQQVSAHLPETIIRRALTVGMPLFGTKPDRPFGRYTSVVKAHPMPSGAVSEEQATAYLLEVQRAYRTEVKTAPRKPDADLVILAYRALVRYASKAQVMTPVEFIQTCVGYAMTNLGVDLIIKLAPKPLPTPTRV